MFIVRPARVRRCCTDRLAQYVINSCSVHGTWKTVMCSSYSSCRSIAHESLDHGTLTSYRPARGVLFIVLCYFGSSTKTILPGAAPPRASFALENVGRSGYGAGDALARRVEHQNCKRTERSQRDMEAHPPEAAHLRVERAAAFPSRKAPKKDGASGPSVLVRTAAPPIAAPTWVRVSARVCVDKRLACIRTMDLPYHHSRSRNCATRVHQRC